MEGEYIHINNWLRPLAWVYGLGVWVRNRCFDLRILKETTFPLPIICVGNLTVGGTGKTPHTEYLIRLLQPTHRTAVLSRGYKRESKGFQLATSNTPMPIIGDEPWQMKHKFPDTIVAVDANRRRGISNLIAPQGPQPQVILLDDAFQHRYVKSGLNILLTDYHHIMTDDALLPAGRLREPLRGKERAHIVIVTKCPQKLTPMDVRVVTRALSLRPYQHLFFTTFQYGTLTNLFTKTRKTIIIDAETHVLLLTGIANPQQLIDDLHTRTKHIFPLSFADHHAFTEKDVEKIENAFSNLQGTNRIIVTTEKDAARILQVDTFSTLFKRHLYVLPVEVKFLFQQENKFNQIITNFVKS